MSRAIKNKSRLFLGLINAPADFNKIKFILFHGPSFADNLVFQKQHCMTLLQHEKYDKCKNTVMYLHGYMEGPCVESVHTIVHAYLARTDTNLIVLDWSDLAMGNYIFDAFINANQLGCELAFMLLNMFANGLDIRKFHLVGHSLGAQLAAVIGRTICRLTRGKNKIRRISALDPARPFFYYNPFVRPLNKYDAHFVDVIHNDPGYYGAAYSTGTADFWPDAGHVVQPGCPPRNFKWFDEDDLCSHRRACQLWAESVGGRYPEKFEAVKAKSWGHFKRHEISLSKDKVYMGHDCPDNICGDFFLQTNDMPPFARGTCGTYFDIANQQAIESLRNCDCIKKKK